MKEAESILSDALRSLKGRITQLISLNRQLLSENEKLKKDRERLIENTENQSVELKKLEEQNKVIKLAKYFNEHNEKKTEIKQKISELVREIEKSIALLNR